jgi:transcriptional regulator
MYIPASFQISDLNTLHRFIEQHSFGLLVSQHEGDHFATHLPFILERSSGSNGALLGHMARANPQWQALVDRSVLTIFSGPHAYISPSWYEAEHVVPTWNYTAVHAYGRVQLIEDSTALLDILNRSVNEYESSMAKPWSLGESTTFLDRMMTQIVGFRIEIDQIEGKWKLSQNHPMERREKVIHSLMLQGDENSVGIAKLMQKQLKTESID